MFLTRLLHCASKRPLGRRFLNNQVGPHHGPSKHLQNSINANQIIKPTLRHLTPITKYQTHDSANLQISHSCIELQPNKYLVNVAFGASTSIVRPSTIMCALDISNSMNGSSTYGNADDECSKFSRWDLVKHSINTIIHCLRPIDRLGIVTFADTGKKQLTFTNMDGNGKRDAIQILNGINPDGMTNLWDGLNQSLSQIDNIPVNSNENICTLLLTDGEPNINPVHGIVEEFVRRNSQNKLFSQVHTFGYGYDLDSTLLMRLSELGGGLFSHVPDHTMCNTAFINFLSNFLSTAINKVNVKIDSFRGFNNILLKTHNIETNQICMGPILSDQTQNLCFMIESNTPTNFELAMNIEYDNKQTTYNINGLKPISKWSFDMPQIPKLLLLDIIQRGLQSNDLQQTCNQLDDVYEHVKQMQCNKSIEHKHAVILNSYLKHIKSNETIEGQLYKAFSKPEWMERWGKHYLKYFIRSHQLQMCTNFKDPSLQHYGGKLFREIKTEVEDIFSTIPTPQPSRSSQSFQGNFQQSFYTPTGPCVDAYGLVQLENREYKLVKDLKQGDRILNSDNNVSTIICVIQTKIKDGYSYMGKVNNMRITPWHPIRINNEWFFPANIMSINKTNCDYVYNFVLDKHHIMTINNVDIITLGHGFTHDSVLTHDFFGTNKVIDNLKKHSGWDNGLIYIDDYKPVYKNDQIVAF